MALTQKLQIRQSQALVMTPQLLQAIKLLQLSNLDLVAYVEAELERNALLDRSVEDEPPPAEAIAASAPDKPPPDDAEPGRQRTSELPAGYSEWAGVGAGGRDGSDYNLEAFVSAEATLADW